jgi:hypothetical protein
MACPIKKIIEMYGISNDGGVNTLNPFIQLSIFFDRRINNIPKGESIKLLVIRLFFHFIYSILASTLVGFLLSIICFFFIIPFFTLSSNIDLYIVFIILTISIFICFLNILLINHRNNELNLPRVLVNAYILINITKFYKKIIFNLLSVVGSSLLLFVTLLPLLFFVTISNKFIPMALLTLFIFTVLVSFIIYSEFSFNELDRSIRQICLWTGVFLIMIGLTIYKMQLILTSKEEQWIELSLLILGLIFTMVTVLDKAREFCRVATRSQNEHINKVWENLESNYTYNDLKIALENEKNNVSEVYQTLKKEWINGNKAKIFRNLLYSLIAVIFGLFIMNLLDNNIVKISNILELLTKKVSQVYFVYLFNGNMRLGISILILTFLFYYFFSKLNLVKVKSFSKIKLLDVYELLLMIFLGILIIIGYLFNLLSNYYFLRIILIPSFLSLLVFSLLLLFLRKFLRF